MPSDPTSNVPSGMAHHIEWDRGTAQVWPLGAAIHHLALTLDDGRRIAPLAEAPWHDDVRITGDETIPAHLRHLGGEWPCAPFGRSGNDPVTHGFGTDNMWRLVQAAPGRAEWEIAYPAGHAIEILRRSVTGIPGRPAVALSLSVLPRRDCMLPVGLHPILKLPLPGEALLVETAFSHGETFPIVFEAGISRLAPDARFSSLDALPLAAGGGVRLAELCHQRTEEAFQVFGVTGALRVLYPRQGHAVRLSWSVADLPTCLFWLSAGGRQAKPWNGCFRGLGVEPLAARFEARAGENRVAGGHAFRAGEIWTTSYSIEVEAIAKEDR